MNAAAEIGTRWIWLRAGNSGISDIRPDDVAFTEWAPHQIIFNIPATRHTFGGRLGVGVKPLRAWLHVDGRRKSKYE